ncbi:MAG TPA: endo-1,4-beta-xylanase, partial [Caulobacteraceae bacterium]|nr:endo-1,4-beta-xylanase [Caulobacteraceae bacterium]
LSDVHIGVCFNPEFTGDPAYTGLVGRQFSQLTPEWNFQMPAILQADGTYDWTKADEITAFARQHDQRVHAHSLIWYALDKIPNFQKLDGDRQTFTDAYVRHIRTVADRFSGVASSWDVVNEAVGEGGEGLRDCLWSRNLGTDDYILLAFQTAAEADPNAILFLNDYNLELSPKKRATFMQLVERLLRRGCPIGGIGTQTHLTLDVRPGMVSEAMRDLAGFGLKIHISEFDVAFGPASRTRLTYAQKQSIHTDLAAETMDAFLALPPTQRHAFSNWGARDRDSFLNRPSNGGDGTDVPDLFDNDARPKPAFWAIADRLAADGGVSSGKP